MIISINRVSERYMELPGSLLNVLSPDVWMIITSFGAICLRFRGGVPQKDCMGSFRAARGENLGNADADR